MSDFLKFAAKYADEVLAIGEALTDLLSGTALAPSVANKVKVVIGKLEAASASISESIAGSEESPIVIRKEDIEAAVAKYLNAQKELDNA